MVRKKERKGIATETIFYIVIGIAVVSLVVLLVVNYSRTARDEGACRSAQDRYCEEFAAEGYTEDEATWVADEKFSAYNPPATCIAPPASVCRARGYAEADGGV